MTNNNSKPQSPIQSIRQTYSASRSRTRSFLRHSGIVNACCLAALGLSSCSPQTPKTPTAMPQKAELSIPKPSEMKADVKVEGRLSTLLAMDIKKLGRQIPYTYSAGKISNSPGYEWWVSKHFAIKSDLPEAKVKLYLELLEMSYPHYVELFGAEPANIDNQRIAVVYGKSRASTRNTMLDDGFRRGVHKNAGGETMYYNRAGYSFPSSREQHQRYIVIHETMHAYHMALSGHSTWAPNWITEGLADSIASHVYYPERQQLAVMVRDRAPMSYLISGLKQFYAADKPGIAEINDDPALKRGLNFFIIHFLLSDPERAQYFAWFRDQLMAANPHSEATLPTANKLLKEVFPDWDQLEAAFQEYVKSQNSSFHIASGPWEQDGSAYWIRVQEEKQQPRLDIGINPKGELLSTMQNAVDFPGPLANPLIIPAAESQLGLLVKYQPGQLHRGQVGIGLGLELHPENQAYRKDYQVVKEETENTNDNKTSKNEKAKIKRPDYALDSYFPLWMKEGRYLVFEGPQYQAFALNPQLLDAMKKQNEKGAKLGINLSISNNSLIVELRSELNGELIKQRETISLSEEQIKRLRNSAINLLANNVSHRLTPYLQFPNNAQTPRSEGQTKIVSNPWQFVDMPKLQRVFRACLHEQNTELAKQCSDTLPTIYASLNNEHQQASATLSTLENALLASDNQDTLKQLAGLNNRLRYNRGKPQLLSEIAGDATLNSTLSWKQQEQNLDQSIEQSLSNHAVADLHNVKASTLNLKQKVNWKGRQFTITEEFENPGFDGVCMVDRNNLRDGKLQNLVKITGPYSGKTKGTLRIDVMPSQAVRNSVQTVDVEIAPYETKSFKQLFELNPDYKGPITIHSSANLDVDGEAIYLSQDQRINQ
ncbi:hypothetical protein [Pseudoteredinibacter isoporae]|uniref:Uncharacterized protein n=1 Tax=Pseudoteredinibacter isoporae TaxID=570281 RepID=A0A7X0JQI5_9GAMM|nr:hypothetical protein [Pseudoteredinibacter isoporae]MBB6520385.1 hypothetical protein [Pseudoteredinibacter isoporae]NHO85954.1 hypothetical protein [Pseudoteredinibacter isoporae]NIB25594.1 hypothetical protein [Pseudoteredinibacter isoporae]